MGEFKGQSQTPQSLKEFQVQALYGIIIASHAQICVKSSKGLTLPTVSLVLSIFSSVPINSRYLLVLVCLKSSKVVNNY